VTSGSRRERGRRLAKAVLLVVAGAIVLVFVVQNDQPVTVRFWFVNRYPRLIFVIVGCLLIGGVIGYLVGRPRRASRRHSAS
jgi:uncharacterized integral membrane protein